MLRALYTFLIIAVLSAIAIWLADNPGELVMHWRGYEIRTSFVIGVAAMALAAFLALFFYRIVVSFIETPASVSAFLEKRRQQKGFLALSRGMVAVAAGDAGEAKRYAAQAHKLLDAPPLTLLLAAQAAQLEGNEAAATGYFEQMLAAPETEFLGLRGLFIQARRAGDRDKALAYARRAFELRPQTP
jgi:HemY protein